MGYSRPQSYQSISIYNDPASAQVGYSCPQSYESIAIYSDPAPAHVGIPALEVTKVSLFAMILPLPRCIAIYHDPALAQVGYSRAQSYQGTGIAI